MLYAHTHTCARLSQCCIGYTLTCLSCTYLHQWMDSHSVTHIIFYIEYTVHFESCCCQSLWSCTFGCVWLVGLTNFHQFWLSHNNVYISSLFYYIELSMVCPVHTLHVGCHMSMTWMNDVMNVCMYGMVTCRNVYSNTVLK